ncbi:sigma-70 family RNA polymerase sigma factor [Alterisphingorhabdus coralli]|uniref:Sigma-70 family RNA polymerase sigma factor n=1 Tax=Alterisphingorhabdus coralli TaxID=3071408 RepID=A0AA97I022_9SPHN|nr:sigma-70 family RNA polymerase sigma factor [Parasphingorhabdus sp. SCSIO 66989]WOE73983.1 sigma-70 family RNA polymerase sigma factor [Parasphingorhabdus sp. SCSIO 66989]
MSEQLLHDLLQQIAEGDQAALSSLYRRTSAKLFGICLMICKDRMIAEDVLQSAYVKIWNKARYYNPEKASPISWMAAIARNGSIDAVRKTMRLADGEELQDTMLAKDAVAAMEQSDDARHIRRCLAHLEADRGAAIRSAYFEGLSYSQVAERMNVPLGTMKSWIRRAMAQLRQCLDGVRI